MSLFNINYPNFIWQLMPVRLRQNIHYAWLKCLAAPVVYLHSLFAVNRSGNLYNLAHNSQVCYIEAALNDTFDITDRGIFISDPPYFDPIYLFKAAEDKMVFIDMDSEIGTAVIPAPDPVPLYTEGEVLFLAPSFIVNVPSSIFYDTDRMNALIEKYRLPGRNVYTITTY